MKFASGDIEMASHGEPLVNLGVRTGASGGFRDPSTMWPEPTRHEPARLRARSTSHSVAARTAAPWSRLRRARAQRDETILTVGVEKPCHLSVHPPGSTGESLPWRTS